jgi:hypothetical protein
MKAADPHGNCLRGHRLLPDVLLAGGKVVCVALGSVMARVNEAMQGGPGLSF